MKWPKNAKVIISPITLFLLFTAYRLIYQEIYPAFTSMFPSNNMFQQKQLIYCFCLVLNNILILLIYNLIINIIYQKKLIFFQQFRIYPSKKWPWEQNQSEWKMLEDKTIKRLLINNFLFAPFLALINVKIHFKVNMNPSQSPSFIIFVGHFLILMIIEDFFFFFGHYFLHQNRYFYKLHKIHHEYTECTSLAGEYAHIFEFILTNTLPSILGIVILSELTQLHVITALTFLGFIIIDACNAHSGYLWPWDILQAIPYCGGGKFHYLHHSLNCGNYGSMFQFWDWVFNTKISQQYDKYD